MHLSWERAGEGEPLVLLHGIGSTRDDFIALRGGLEESFEVLAPDLPGHGASGRLARRPTVSALTDALESDLDELGLERVHLLGNSLGARLALELAARGRASSVVAIAPSGLNLPPERVYQGLAMAQARILFRTLRPVVAPAARTRLGRTALLFALRSAPWRASQAEAIALRGGFGESEGFWSMLWWAVLLDVPTKLGSVTVPVTLAQGTLDLIASGQTPRFLALVPGSAFVPLWWAGHAPQSDAADTILGLVRRCAASASTGEASRQA